MAECDLGSSGFVGSAGRFSTVIVGGVGAFGSVGFVGSFGSSPGSLGRPTFELMANQ